LQPLGFRFDVDAVLLDQVAHRPDCRLVLAVPSQELVLIPAGDVFPGRPGDRFNGE
jgi:hypothetical protein